MDKYIQGLIGYASSPINLYGWNLPPMQERPILSLEILSNRKDFLLIQIHNPKTYNLVQQYPAKSLN
jgi:hypothetical protein